MASASTIPPQKQVSVNHSINTSSPTGIASSPLYTNACFEPKLPHANPAVIANRKASSTVTSSSKTGHISSTTTRASPAGIRKTTKTTTNTRIFSKLHRHTTAQRYILRKLAGDIKGDIPYEQGNKRPTGSAGPFAVRSQQQPSHSHPSHYPQQPHQQQQERRQEMADITNDPPRKFSGSGIVQAALRNAILLAAKVPPPPKEGGISGTMERETRKRSGKGGLGGRGSVRGGQRNQKGVEHGHSGLNQAQERLQQSRAVIPTSQALDRVKGASVTKSSRQTQKHRITAERKSGRGKGSKLNPGLKRGLEKEMETGSSQGRVEGSAVLLPAPILGRIDTFKDGEGKRAGNAGAIPPIGHHSYPPKPSSRHAQRHVPDDDDEDEDDNPGYDGHRRRHHKPLFNQPTSHHHHHQQAGPSYHNHSSTPLPTSQNPDHHRHHDPSNPNHTYYDPYNPNNNDSSTSSPQDDTPFHTGYTPRSTPPPLNNKYTTQIRRTPHRTRHMIRATLRLGLKTGTLVRPPPPPPSSSSSPSPLSSSSSSKSSSRGDGSWSSDNPPRPGLRVYTAGLWVDNRRDGIMKGVPPVLVPGTRNRKRKGSGPGFAVDGGRGYTDWDEGEEDYDGGGGDRRVGEELWEA